MYLKTEPTNSNPEGFFAESYTSPNGNYVLGWSDSIFANNKLCLGSYVLLYQGKIICEGNLKRPQHGKVANNGTFILNDRLNWSPPPSGTFYVMDNQNNILLKRSFRANLMTNGLSPDGKYAICLTHASSNIFFDVKNNKAKRLINITQTADYFDIDSENQIIHLVRSGKKFAISFKGKFVDEEKYYNTDFSIIETEAKNSPSPPSPATSFSPVSFIQKITSWVNK